MLRVKQIDPTEFAAAVVQYSTGTAFSGAINAYVNAGGYLGTGFISITGNQDATGIKRFLDGVRVPYNAGSGFAPTALYVTDQDALISGALVTRDANLSGFFMGASGSLSAVRVSGSATIPIVNLTGLNGTSVLYSGGWIFISASGAGGGGGSSNTSVTGSSAISAPNFTGVGSVTLTYDGTYVRVSGVTGSSTIVNTGNSTVFNITGVTGNYVNMSFWLDQYSLITGLNQVESFVSRDFIFTGYALGVINTGTQGILSGGLYQRTPTNAKVPFAQFSLGSAMVFSGQGGFAQVISGMNRVGLDIYLIGTGITGLSVGVFGAGT